MIDLGHIALILAFILAIFSSVISIIGLRNSLQRWTASARYGLIAVTALYTVSMLVMIFAFVTKDFSLRIVSENTSTNLPSVYSLTAIYADKTGSMFFWGWLISLFSAVLLLQKRRSDKSIMPHAILILAILEAFFLALVTLVSNVFQKNPVPPVEGFGLNPLLQNFGMLLHPPLLYIGFAGFAIVFAFVIAALINRSATAEWVRGIRRWALFAWCTLGIGNLIGMWWSYNELGWGGIWAWDPVENAGLMPWLLGTAFVHTIAIVWKRKCLYTWSFALIIFTFVFTLLSPFITHGGIESPLHGFLSSNYPPYLLAAILITLVGSIGLLYFRRRGFKDEQRPQSLVSKEGAFLVTNILFVILVFIIILGVIYPQIREGLGGGSVSLNRSFFDWVCGPIMLVVVFFIGICSLLEWRKATWNAFRRNLAFTLLPAAFVALIILVIGIGNWYAVTALVCGFPLFTILLQWYRGVRARHTNKRWNFISDFLSLIWSNKSRHGGYIVHIGVILITIGVVGSTIYDTEKTATLDVGDSMTIGGYGLTYDGIIIEEQESKLTASATMSVNRGDRLVGEVNPRLDYWFYRMESYAEVSVRTTLAEDLFVSMVWVDFDSSGDSATFRVMVNPLVVWMWIGGAVLLLGGVIAFWPERKKQLVAEIQDNE